MKKTQTELREIRDRIDQTNATIDKIGPFEVEQVANAVKAGRNFIVEEKKLIEMAEQFLDGARKLSDNDEQLIKAQEENVKKAIRIYNKKFR